MSGPPESMSGTLSKDEALALSTSGWWKPLDAKEVAKSQLTQPWLCMPWDDFVAAVKSALGRPVWTHEFADRGALLHELRFGRGQDPPMNASARTRRPSHE